MERLGHRDYQNILHFTEELYSLCDLSEFTDRLLVGLRKLIPCDGFVSYNVMNPDLHSSTDRGWPSESEPFTPQFEERWRSLMHEHPVLMHQKQTGNLQALRISDFLSARQFQKLALYQEFYRKLGVQDGLCKAIHVSGPNVLGCGIHRCRRSFTQRDCLVLDLLGPHVTQAWRNARAVTRLHQEADAVEKAAEVFEFGVVTLTPSGRVKLVTQKARLILEEFFGFACAGDHQLPEMLARWVRCQNEHFVSGCLSSPRSPLEVERGETSLVVRLVNGALDRLLLLQVLRPEPDSRNLESLGLTPREAQVLSWVAYGKTNAEIGLILGASQHTVRKHLEHILTKLTVETRTAAARVAIKKLRTLTPSSQNT